MVVKLYKHHCICMHLCAFTVGVHTPIPDPYTHSQVLHCCYASKAEKEGGTTGESFSNRSYDLTVSDLLEVIYSLI